MGIAESLQTRRAEREALLQRVTSLLKGDPRIVAAWLIGSLARGDADDLSDIDLWVVVADEHATSINAAQREYVSRLGEPLLIEEAPQNAPAGGAYLLVLYGGEAGPHQIDWYWQPQSDARVPLDGRILFDRAGIPSTTQAELVSQQDCAQALSHRVVFFWAMANITAKKIARRQGWAALSMLDMLRQTLEEIEWLAGVANSPPGYEDRRTTPPPVEADQQMDFLREMCREVESLIPHITALGGSAPSDAISHIYRFFDLAEQMFSKPR